MQNLVNRCRRLVVRTPAVIGAVVLLLAGTATAYFTASGASSASAAVGTLSAPGSVTATPSGGHVTVTWTGAEVDGTVAAKTYAVERYDSSGNDLGPASCSPATSPCTDSPGAGRFEYKVTASYDSWSTTSSFSNTVSNGTTSTSLLSSANPSVSGQQVTFTATVTASPAGTPTAGVEFFDGGSPISGCTSRPLSSGSPYTATCLIAFSASGGSQSITAQYLGDTTYPSSTSSAVTQTVNAASTTTSLSSGTNPTVTGQSTTYTATVSASSPGSGTPTGYVEFLDGSSAIAACGGSSGTALNGSGVATCAQSYNVGAGGHTITAKYLADGNYNASTSAGVTQTVNQASTTTALTSGTNPSVTGQSTTLRATVTANSPGSGTPTGSVEFLDGSTAVAACGGTSGTAVNASGVASCSPSFTVAGSPHSLTAKYLADANYSGSTSTAVSQTVNKVATTTALVSSNNPSVSGQSTTFTATVSANSPGSGTPPGNVEFLDAGTAISACGGTSGVAMSSGSATCAQTYNASGGNHTITAVYLADTNYGGSTSTAVSQTVNKAATSTAVGSNYNPIAATASVTYTATVSVTSPGSGSASGSVTFKDGPTTISCGSGSSSFNGTTATCVTSYASTTGSPHSITAVYSSDGDFASSTSAALSESVVNDANTVTLGQGENGSSGTGTFSGHASGTESVTVYVCTGTVSSCSSSSTSYAATPGSSSPFSWSVPYTLSHNTSYTAEAWQVDSDGKKLNSAVLQWTT